MWGGHGDSHPGPKGTAGEGSPGPPLALPGHTASSQTRASGPLFGVSLNWRSWSLLLRRVSGRQSGVSGRFSWQGRDIGVRQPGHCQDPSGGSGPGFPRGCRRKSVFALSPGDRQDPPWGRVSTSWADFCRCPFYDGHQPQGRWGARRQTARGWGVAGSRGGPPGAGAAAC